MNAEMMDALQALAVDRGISVETLLTVLADAMQSAYEKMPNAHEYAWVMLSPETGEFKVMAQHLDDDGEPAGEEFDVTPDDFGRIVFELIECGEMRKTDRDQLTDFFGVYDFDQALVRDYLIDTDGAFKRHAPATTKTGEA